jgi:hypothetical protein
VSGGVSGIQAAGSGTVIEGNRITGATTGILVTGTGNIVVRNSDGVQGARENPRFLTGYIWAENAGWINLGGGVADPCSQYPSSQAGPSSFGVNLNRDPANPTHLLLSGYAWGENVGWVNFGPWSSSPPDNQRAFIETLGVTLLSGRLRGYAWSENGGWINFGPWSNSPPESQCVTFCYPNCDGSTASPILNINDFQCFVNHFAAGCS